MDNRFKSMDKRFESMETRINRLAIFNVVIVIAVVVTGLAFYSHLIGQTQYGRERAKVLQQVSRLASFERCDGNVTSFGLAYRGYATEVTVSHIVCDPKSPPLLACKGVDVALTGECPTVDALNGVYSSDPSLADPVIALGFYSGQPTIWQGVLSSVFTKAEVFPPFQNMASLPDDTFIINGDQNKGMSGAAVLNSYGLLGVASSTFQGSFNNSRQVAAIPIHHVFKCMMDYQDQLPTTSFCKAKGLEVVAVPYALSVYDTFSRIWKMISTSGSKNRVEL
jgi:hypothetical protein